MRAGCHLHVCIGDSHLSATRAITSATESPMIIDDHAHITTHITTQPCFERNGFQRQGRSAGFRTCANQKRGFGGGDVYGHHLQYPCNSWNARPEHGLEMKLEMKWFGTLREHVASRVPSEGRRRRGPASLPSSGFASTRKCALVAPAQAEPLISRGVSLT